MWSKLLMSLETQTHTFIEEGQEWRLLLRSKSIWFQLESAFRPIKFTIRNTRLCVCCLFVASRKIHFPVNWRILVEGCSANIGLPLPIFLGVLANQSTVRDRGVSRGRVCGCGCWLSDRWQVTSDTNMWHVTHDMCHFLGQKWSKKPKKREKVPKIA